METYEPYDPASRIQDTLVFGEFGDVNPSITDSSTFTFLSPATMEEVFEHEVEGCFLYSRHWNPSDKYLANALADLEDTPSALVTASGMAAIACTVLQTCGAGDEIVCSRTIYGGTYALFRNVLPRFGIRVRFVPLSDPDALASALTPSTKLVFCESISNPLLDVADIGALANTAHAKGVKLAVDNTFSPMILSPYRLGADIVIHSLTKFINGTSDCVAGCVCADDDFIHRLSDVNSGASMLLGPVLDSMRASSILKNLHSLHIRMQKHSFNAMHLACALQQGGFKVHYPGLPSHPQHELLKRTGNSAFGFGGMLSVDVETADRANRLMTMMQEEKVGYLAVSLGYFKTLFSSPSHSTSSEIPIEEQQAMGMSSGLVRISVGLDHDIDRSLGRIVACLNRL